MLGTMQYFVHWVLAPLVIAPLFSLLAEGFKDLGSIETSAISLQQAGFSSSEMQRLPEGSMQSLFPVAASRNQLNLPSSQGLLGSEGGSAGPGLSGEGLGAASAHVLPFPFAQGLQKESLKLQNAAMYTEVAAVLTPSRYSASLQWDINRQLHSNPGVTPIIRARWHTAEPYVAAAAALRDDQWRPFFFVVLAEFAPMKTQDPTQFLKGKGFAFVPATQESLTDKTGKPLPYPFSLPTPLQLLQSAFGNEYALKVLAPGHLPSRAQALDGLSSSHGASDSAAAGSSGRSARSEANQTRETASAFLRWLPFGLTRTSPAAEFAGQLPAAQPGEVSSKTSPGVESPENEEVFAEALSRTLPRQWLKAPDGRRLVIVLNDQIKECRTLLHLAVKSSRGGTPVFVESSEGLDARKLLMRLGDERIAGKKIAFVLFALGGSELMSMNTAFLDRAVLRVPKADDIKSFLKRKEEEAAEELATQREELKEMQQHMEKRKEHLLELGGGEKAARVGEININSHKDFGGNGQLEALSPSRVEQPSVLLLNPFDEFLFRFNYTEVSDLTSYAEALAMELKSEPLEISIGGEPHRVAVMILSDPPETDTELGPAWMQFNRLIHMAIAISMFVGLLCCLCMWRLMLLLKQR